MNFVCYFLAIFFLFAKSSISMRILIVPESLNSTVLECVHYCMTTPNMSDRISKCYKNCTNSFHGKIKRNSEITVDKNSYDIELICRDDKSLTVVTNAKESEFHDVVLTEFIVYGGDIENFYLANSPFGFFDKLNPNTTYFIHGFGYKGNMHQLSDIFDLNPTTFSTLPSNYFVQEVHGINVTNFRNSPDCKFCLYADVIWLPSADKVCHYEVTWHDTTDDGDFNQIPFLVELEMQNFYQITIDNLDFGKEYKVAVRSFMNSRDESKNDFKWITFVTPNCRDMFQDPEDIEQFCSPLQPAGVVTEHTHVSENKYNVMVTWKKSPEHVPLYYGVTLRNLDYKMPLSTMMNVDGHKTEASFPEVELTGFMYEVTVEANYPNGKRSSTTITKHILGSSDKINSKHLLALGIAISIIGIIVMIVLCKCTNLKCEKHPCKTFLMRRSNDEIKENVRGTNLQSFSTSNSRISFCILNDKYEIDDENIEICDIRIGEGQFGIVHKAVLRINGENIIAAVKEIKGDFREQTDKLIEEIRIMKSVPAHRNILRLIGHRTDLTKKMLLMTEYCGNGNLLNFLRNEWEMYNSMNQSRQIQISHNFSQQINVPKNVENPCYIDKPLTLKALLDIAAQVAEGMNFLQMHKVVHRDLAARNVLLNENNVAKIADFGLSRDVYEDGLYVIQNSKHVPIRWMAIEALKLQDYTSQSDVWSYGVLLYEIITLGCIPYPNIANDKILTHLDSGSRMERPRSCPQWLYNVMVSCWEEKRELRPHFVDIVEILTGALDNIPNEQLFDMNHIKEDVNLVRHNLY